MKVQGNSAAKVNVGRIWHGSMLCIKPDLSMMTLYNAFIKTKKACLKTRIL